MTFDQFLRRNAPPEPERDPLTEAVIGAAIEVHKEVGPGLTENMYEEALCYELDLRGLRYARQVIVPVAYKGKPIGDTRIDLIVEGRLIVELKAFEAVTSVHRAQVITYLRVTGLHLGLIINFDGAVLKDGIKRVILSR